MAAKLIMGFGLSIRRTGKLLGVSRCLIAYLAKQSALNQKVVLRLRELAAKHSRYGVWVFHRMLRREGFEINHKRTERLYRMEKLGLRQKKRKKFKSTKVFPVAVISKPNEKWSMDFIHDSLWNGRNFRTLSVLDIFPRENLRLEVDTSMGGHRVTRVLDEICSVRGFPESIGIDNGPEFRSRQLYQWSIKNNVRLDFSRPGKPTDNAFVESFHGKFRNNCLNENYFQSLKEARTIIENWRIDYNTSRPHRSLNGSTLR